MECEECGGTGLTCGVHATADGCDCEDSDRENERCDSCGGTGLRED